MNKVKNTKSSGRHARPNHVFRRIRDPFVTDAGNANPTALNLSTDASGNATTYLTVAPLGLRAIQASNSSASGPITFQQVPFIAAPLPWLYGQSRNFERYRMLNATIVVVGSVGSNATGRISLVSTTDYADVNTITNVGLSAGGKVFDIASLSGKEQRFALDVDTSWKKVSATVVSIGSSGTALLPTSNYNDLIATNVQIGIYGYTASGGSSVVATNFLSFFLEYDVEFRDPISFGANV